MYYRVIPFSGSFDTYGLIYSSSQTHEIWSIVSIPFKNHTTLAMICQQVDATDISFERSDIREIEESVVDFIFLREQDVQIIDFVSEHYICPIHHALWLYFPKNLLEKIHKNTFQNIKKWKYQYQSPEIILSPKQEGIYRAMNSSMDQKSQAQASKHLLYGVTWSGKTEIYMKLIAENLKNWRQTLLLIPEIVLTSQIGERMQKMFGDDVILLHSWVSPAKKSQYWMDIYRGEAKIIIGTRSSIFYPYKNLWAIIMDEEHDESYISENSPRYHTLEVIEKICEISQIPLVLGSGTPRATTFYRALQWEFHLHQLLEVYSSSL